MPIILAHRGNVAGPSSATENRMPAMRDALALGWSVAADIRRTPEGQFYFSHQPETCTFGLYAEDLCALFRRYPRATIALNLRETGDEAALLDLLHEHALTARVVLHGMERVETKAGDCARRLRALNPVVRIAARVSDRSEPIERALSIEPASIVWLDEFDSPWCTEDDIRGLKLAGMQVFAVSPDLHGRSFEATRARWVDFIRWGVDAICTDYPAALDRLVQALAREAA